MLLVPQAFTKLLKELNMTSDQAKKQAPAILNMVFMNHVVPKWMKQADLDAATTPIGTMQLGQTLKVSRV